MQNTLLEARREAGPESNSKHWFTTSFLQPLPYLVTSQVPENSQLTSSFGWCSNSSKFVTNSSDKTRRVIYSRQQSIHQQKYNHNRLNRDGTLFLPGVDAGPMFTWVSLSEGADRVGGQLRGDKEWPFSDVTKSGRVRRKVPENDARSVVLKMTAMPPQREGHGNDLTA